MPRGIVERQCRERIEHAIVAGDAPVAGLDPEDGHQVLGRHLVRRGHALERLAMIGPELRPVVHALGIEEVLAVLPPRGDLLDRPAHHVDDLLLRSGLLQQPLHVLALEPIVLRNLGDEGGNFRAMQVEARRQRRRVGRLRERPRAGEQREQREQRETTRLQLRPDEFPP